MVTFGAFHIDGTNGPTDLPSGVRWVASKFDAAVIHHLHSIRRTETGRIVERHIANAPRKLTIKPEPSAKHAKAQTFGKPDGKSDVTIFFTPGHYVERAIGFTYKLRGALGMKADEVLLHEMVHAMRKLSGRETTGGGEVQIDDYVTSSLAAKHHAQRILWFDNEEEFNAVTLANIYISEKNNRRLLYGRDGYDLRRDHNSENAHVPLASPHGYDNHPIVSGLLRSLIRSQKTVCDEIALVPATFNPIRDFLVDEQPDKMTFLFLKKFKAGYSSFEFYRITIPLMQTRLGFDQFNKLYDSL